MLAITQPNADEVAALVPALADLLCDTVNGGASIGFVAPLDAEAAAAFWHGLLPDIAAGRRILLVAWLGGVLVGTAQLELATKANGLHRAEVQKVIVHHAYRRRGIGGALMAAIDETARECHRTLLVLDTERESGAEALYEGCGYVRVGSIPGFALGATDGLLHDNVIYYRLLPSA